MDQDIVNLQTFINYLDLFLNTPVSNEVTIQQKQNLAIGLLQDAQNIKNHYGSFCMLFDDFLERKTLLEEWMQNNPLAAAPPLPPNTAPAAGGKHKGGMNREVFANITAKTQTLNQQTRKNNSQGKRFSAPGFSLQLPNLQEEKKNNNQGQIRQSSITPVSSSTLPTTQEEKKNNVQGKRFSAPGFSLNMSAISKEIQENPGYLGNNPWGNDEEPLDFSLNNSNYPNTSSFRRKHINTYENIYYNKPSSNIFAPSNDPVEALNIFVRNARKTRRNVEKNSPNMKFGKTFMLRKEGEEILDKHKQYLHYHGKNTRVQQFKSIMKNLLALEPKNKRSAQYVAINKALKSLEGGKRKSRKHRK